MHMAETIKCLISELGLGGYRQEQGHYDEKNNKYGIAI